jgi:nitrate/nitrite transport system ATP-binding protein
LNDNAAFKKTRNEIIEYLMEIGNERSSNSEIQYELPDLQPKDLRWEFKASK